MEKLGDYTRTEIFSQPEIWADVLDVMNAQRAVLQSWLQNTSFDSILFTGCGSTFYLSLAAAAVCQQITGLPSRGLPASEIWLNPRSAYGASDKQLLVAISRSGETTETLSAVEAFRQRGHGEVLALSCNPDSLLMKLGTINLSFPSAQEQSIAQTRAFSALYLAAIAFTSIFADEDTSWSQLGQLPTIGRRLLTDYAELTHSIGTNPAFDRFYFLGSGARYGLACELSLKMKEMSLSHSEPFHFLEFRHGPMSMVTPSTLIVGLLSEENEAREKTVLDDMQRLGATVFTEGGFGADVMIEGGLNDAVRSVLMLPIGQLIAYEHAISKGLNPDRPHQLSAVVRF